MSQESFHMGIVVDGHIIYPEGWFWILVLAKAGVSWALERVNTEEFRQLCLDRLKIQTDRRIEDMIDEIIDQLKTEVMS